MVNQVSRKEKTHYTRTHLTPPINTHSYLSSWRSNKLMLTHDLVLNTNPSSWVAYWLTDSNRSSKYTQKKKTKRERETNVGKCLAYYFFSWRRRRETRLRFTAWLITSGLCSSRCGCFICCCKRKSVKTYDVGMLAFSLMVLIWYSKLFFIHKYDEFGACHLCWHAATGVGFRDSIHLCTLRHMELLALSKMCVYVCVLWLAPQQLSQPSSVLTGSWADSLARISLQRSPSAVDSYISQASQPA